MKRILSLLWIFLLSLSLITVSALAAEGTENPRPFLSISVDGTPVPESNIIFKTLFELGVAESSFGSHKDVPYYHVIVPTGTKYVDVTYSEDTDIFNVTGGTAYGYATDLTVDAVTSPTVRSKSFPKGYTRNADGTQTVRTPVIGFSFDRNGNGHAVTLEESTGKCKAICLFTFGYDGTVLGDTDGNGTVDITMTLMQGEDGFSAAPGGGAERFLSRSLSIPYFDLGLYDLDRYYYNPDYSSNSPKAGTYQTAEGTVTPMHAYIWATEVYVLGIDPSQAGTGLGKEALGQHLSWSGDPGSTHMNFWNGSSDPACYLDYETCVTSADRHALSDGMTMTVHLPVNTASAPSACGFFQDSRGVRSSARTLQGKGLPLTLYQTPAGGQPQTLAAAEVFCISAEDFQGQSLSQWTSIGTTGADGTFTIPGTLSPGSYYLAAEGADSPYSRGPALLLLKVTKSYGDVNGDGQITSLDAVLVLRNVANILGQADFVESAADVNGDKLVTSLDAVLILRRTANLITEFPVEQTN